jgi:DNA adenine methylase
MAEQIAGLLDYGASTYVEPFGGGAAVLLNKAPHEREIYADKSITLCSFWACMADEGAAITLCERLYEADYDRAAFEYFCNVIDKAEESGRQLTELTDGEVLDIATACFIVQSMSRDGAGLRFRGRDKTHGAYLRSVDRLAGVADRFNGVGVVHGDALELLSGNRFDNPDTMFYFDPVYLPGAGQKDSRSHTLYRCHFDYTAHIKLLERIRGMSAKIVISGYVDDTRLYDRYLIDGEGLDSRGGYCPWKRYEIEALSSVGRGEKERVEVLWTNCE